MFSIILYHIICVFKSCNSEVFIHFQTKVCVTTGENCFPQDRVSDKHVRECKKIEVSCTVVTLNIALKDINTYEMFFSIK